MHTNTTRSIDHLSYTIDSAVRLTGIPRTKLYGDIAAGNLRTFKHGRRRLISADALSKFIADLERQSAPKASA